MHLNVNAILSGVPQNRCPQEMDELCAQYLKAKTLPMDVLQDMLPSQGLEISFFLEEVQRLLREWLTSQQRRLKTSQRMLDRYKPVLQAAACEPTAAVGELLGQPDAEGDFKTLESSRKDFQSRLVMLRKLSATSTCLPPDLSAQCSEITGHMEDASHCSVAYLST